MKNEAGFVDQMNRHEIPNYRRAVSKKKAAEIRKMKAEIGTSCCLKIFKNLEFL